MSWHFWLLVIGAIFVVWKIQRTPDQPGEDQPVEPEHKTLKFFGGPLEGQQVERVPQNFYVIPYLPDEENRVPIRQVGEMTLYEASFAYYTQVTETDYFYTRDISEEELQKVMATGFKPSVEDGDA